MILTGSTPGAAPGECCTRAAISALAAQVHHPKDDVNCAAIYALARIGGPPEVAIFLDAFTDRSPVAKWYSMAAISQYGTEQAIGPVCARVRVILRRQRANGQLPESELLLALKFLARHPGDKRASATLIWVAGRKLSYLTPQEVKWVHSNISAL
jgi:HEAT repeat protein